MRNIQLLLLITGLRSLVNFLELPKAQTRSTRYDHGNTKIPADAACAARACPLYPWRLQWPELSE